MKIQIFFLACLILVVPCQAKTIIVDTNGSADYPTIQAAINNSGNGDTIEVRQGVYHERINFYGKSITITSIDPNNIYVVYATTIDADNMGNVVTFDSGEDAASKLIGFTIQNGNDKGIYCFYSDPLIAKCLVRFSGYGIYGSYAEPNIIDCIVRENSRTGIHNCDGEIENCDIIENTGSNTYQLAGVYGCDGPITSCNITGNSTDGLADCQGSISKCKVSGNSGNGFHGCEGGITNCLVTNNLGYGVTFDYTYASSGHGHVINCTVVGNKRSGVCVSTNYRSATLFNNIVVLNWEYGIREDTTDFVGSITLNYNNIWGNLSGNYSVVAPGDTDTHEDPLFAIAGYWGIEDWVEGDYHLKSIAGRWDPNNHMWVNDDVTSLCIDAGDPVGGCLDEPPPNGGRINQGAYGGTDKASRSPWGIEPYCAKYVPGDVNFDCKVDFQDIAITASYWLQCNLVPQEACLE